MEISASENNYLFNTPHLKHEDLGVTYRETLMQCLWQHFKI